MTPIAAAVANSVADKDAIEPRSKILGEIDNHIGAFANPHPHALNADRNAEFASAMERILSEEGISLPN